MKSHLLLSSEPLSFAGETLCLCGAKLAHPEPVLMVDLCERGLPDFGLRDCAKCIRLAEHDSRLLPADTGAPGWAGRRLYLYAIVEGAEARQYTGELVEGLVAAVDAARTK